MNIFFCHAHHTQQIEKLLPWLGHLHYIFLHFPIVCVFLALFFELVYLFHKDKKYGLFSRWMSIFAALAIIPTLVFGWILSLNMNFQEPENQTFILHQFFAILTTITIVSAIFFLKKTTEHRKIYLFFLILSCIGVTATGFFGGDLAFN